MRIILLLPLFLLVLPASAQLYGHLGISASSMHNKGPIETNKQFTGPQLASGGEFKPAPNATLRIGGAITASLQGYHQQKGANTYTIRMHYVHFPVYAAYPLTPTIQAGGYVAGLMSARFLYHYANTRVPENYHNMYVEIKKASCSGGFFYL